MNKGIELKAYIPSVGEYDECFKKYRAFVSAPVSDNAEKNGARKDKNFCGNGLYFMRNASLGGVYYAHVYGVRSCGLGINTDAGLRVAFQLIYDPQSAICKNCQIKKRTTKVFNDETIPEWSGRGKSKTITSEAPIVEFDGKECIWLNKEACESGVDKTMKLWTLELVDRSVRFDENGDNNDFAKATELQAQCLGIFSKKAQKELVTVRMSSEDNYESATPVDDEGKVRRLFLEVFEGDITEEELRDRLLKIINNLRNSEASTEQDAVALGKAISSEMALLEEKLEARRKQEEESRLKQDGKGKAFDSLEETVTKMKIGDEHE